MIHYELGLTSFRAAQFPTALTHFRKSIQLTNDGPARTMSERCRKVTEGGVSVGDGWDGIWAWGWGERVCGPMVLVAIYWYPDCDMRWIYMVDTAQKVDNAKLLNPSLILVNSDHLLLLTMKILENTVKSPPIFLLNPLLGCVEFLRDSQWSTIYCKQGCLSSWLYFFPSPKTSYTVSSRMPYLVRRATTKNCAKSRCQTWT